ncbi:hypothetical protein C5C95_00205 [Rathayibacter sp. AY1B7]|uniref:restriction endonuclease n=1 Tax=Rathayibacter sp. AY1B7 TaxID=2080532 RepID=UPI000CE743D6|nr:restriction endonuclease [Rathayibacter sp. AY1B7]PPI02665.1 hypothetical protein C5C95_00205 [Rathayibacter sp. AY1B7]
MTRISWERYEGNDVEAVVAMLINRERSNSVRITPSKGDGGVDILDRGAAARGGDVVYQVKRYTEPLSASQRNNIEESWARLQADPRWGALDVQEWHLVTPWDPTPEADAWLQGLDNSERTIVWHGLTYIEVLATKYPEIIDYYLDGGRSRIEDAYQAVVAILAPADANSSLDVPNVSSRLAKALTVLDGDPHYRYEVRLGEGTVPHSVERPNLVMTWIESQGLGKKWQAVDVIARCAASVTERPIIISGSVRAEDGSDLATALQDFVDYGAPFAAPAGAFAGSIDAPGGLGGPLTNAAVRVLPVVGDLGADPHLILATQSREGLVIAETEVTRVERSAGTKGFRVVLQQRNNVFTIEDRYTETKGGKRVIRFGDFSHQPALEVRAALTFITSATPPNMVTVRRKGVPASSATVDKNWSIDFSDEISRVLEGVAGPAGILSRLQQFTGMIVKIPDLTKTTSAQVAEWRRVARILEGEDVMGTYPEGYAVGVELVAEVDTIPGPLAIEVPLDVTIGRQEIQFGKALMWIEDATVLDRREVDGHFLHWLSTPDRRIRFSLPKDDQDGPVGEPA